MKVNKIIEFQFLREIYMRSLMFSTFNKVPEKLILNILKRRFFLLRSFYFHYYYSNPMFLSHGKKIWQQRGELRLLRI